MKVLKWIIKAIAFPFLMTIVLFLSFLSSIGDAIGGVKDYPDFVKSMWELWMEE